MSFRPMGNLVLMLFPFIHSQILLSNLYVQTTGLSASFTIANDLCTHGTYNPVGNIQQTNKN